MNANDRQGYGMARNAGWLAASLSALAAIIFFISGTTTLALIFAVLVLVWVGMALSFK